MTPVPAHIAGKFLVFVSSLALLAVIWVAVNGVFAARTEGGRVWRMFLTLYGMGALLAMITALISALAPGVWTWTW